MGKVFGKKLIEEYAEGYSDPGNSREDTMTLLTKSWKENLYWPQLCQRAPTWKQHPVNGIGNLPLPKLSEASELVAGQQTCLK